ncbi:MAG: hypothetical protein KAJ40_06460 [Alphaproteobacteria bacterium]|nr:hypothetical protein [Alphaproteobacteria bacterium]
MANKKEDTENTENTEKQQDDKKSNNIKVRIWLAFITVVGVVFLPTSMLLFVGMLPSAVIYILMSRRSSAKVSTVSAMNLAGCIPFIFKLWSSENDFEASLDIVMNTRYMVIIYTAAMFGYMIDWVVTGIVSSFLYQSGIKRMEAIKKRQEELVLQWGDVVIMDKKNVDYSTFNE